MTSLKTILYATITSACLLPLGIFAQDLEEEAEELAPVYASEIEIGIAYNSEDSYKFGKFNGLTNEGAFFIGNFNLRKNRIAGDTSTDYWELTGRDLGLDSRSVYAEYSRAGSFSVYLDFDQRVNNLIDDGQTPFIGSGGSVLTLPANWITNTGNNGVGDFPNLFSSLNNVTIEKDRKKYGGGISWDITDVWQIRGNYHREDKDGTDEFGAIFGTSGGNPRGSIVAIPHDFTFNEFDLGLVYKGDKLQLTLTGNMSLFDNNIDSLRFTNPFSRTSSWDPAANFPAVGQYSNIFPDNEAWSINFSGGYNWSRNTRMTTNLTYGEMTQNQPFLPFTSIPALSLAATEPLPRANLNGQIDNLYANVNLTHRFNNKLNLKARFTYDDRDNSTPRDLYYLIHGDAGSQVAIDGARVNRPYSYKRSKFEIDAGYRLPHMSKLTVGYTYEDIDRNYQEVANNKEHKFHVKLNTMPAAWMSAWAKYTYSSRDGSTYISNQPLLDGHDAGVIAALVAADPNDSDLWENDPWMRKYYMADRDRNQFSANANFYPNDEVVLSVFGRYAHDAYDNTRVGLMNSTRSSLTFDAAYSPSAAFSANVFFTLDKNDYAQRGFARRGSPALTPVSNRIAANGSDFWRVFTENSVYTTGAGFEWEVIEDKFDVTLDIIYSDATTDIEPLAEDLANANRISGDMPFSDVKTRTFSINLKGDYKLKDGWGTRVYYWYERYDSTDFAFDSIEVNALANGGTGGNVILLGNQPFDYNAHVIGITIYREF